jgi:UMF1 family MFS transporter
LFLPLTLEQLARERGVLWSDKATPCVPSVTPNTGSNDSGSTLASSMLTRGVPETDNGQCVIYPFGSEVNTTSFALYTSSLAVLVQALTLVSVSSVADHGRW